MHCKKITILVALLSTNVYADGFSASVGGDYSTGKYGTSDSTDVFYMPISASYATGRMTYRLTVPFLRVTGPGDFVPGGLAGSGSGSTVVTTTNNCRSINSGSGNSGGPGRGQKICDTVTTVIPGQPATPATPATRTRTTESGFGDISAAATFNAVDSADWVVDFTGKIKFPTGSESKGLSNGETDFALQANVEKSFGAPFVGIGLGYRWLGEPSGVDFDNITYGSLEGGYKFNDKFTAGVSYDWATAAVSDASKPQEISVYGTYRVNDHYKLNAVLYTGLSNANPDVGAGFTLNYYF
jgi:hypothetical protein